MKSVRVFAFTLLFIGFAAVVMAVSNGPGIIKNDKPSSTENKGFALVELFTSEGCSSCPPADELVAKVEKEVGDKPIYILAYHVDYWDRLGWKDTFSSAIYTKRQNQYADWLNLSQIYTPQIVVNGKTEFVGSQEGALRAAIKTALAGNNALQLDISETRGEHNKARIQFKVNGSIDKANDELVLALVQKHAVSKIKSGENSGRTLMHAQIVRGLQSLPLQSKDNADIALPVDLGTDAWEVIGFVQNTRTGAVLAATKSNLK